MRMLTILSEISEALMKALQGRAAGTTGVGKPTVLERLTGQARELDLVVDRRLTVILNNQVIDVAGLISLHPHPGYPEDILTEQTNRLHQREEVLVIVAA
jgi:hypothetical protein